MNKSRVEISLDIMIVLFACEYLVIILNHLNFQEAFKKVLEDDVETIHSDCLDKLDNSVHQEVKQLYGLSEHNDYYLPKTV